MEVHTLTVRVMFAGLEEFSGYIRCTCWGCRYQLNAVWVNTVFSIMVSNSSALL